MDWYLVSSQLYFTINLEEIFYFNNKKMPYLCGVWRFANAYLRNLGKENWPMLTITDLIAVISLCATFYSLGYVRGKHDSKTQK